VNDGQSGAAEFLKAPALKQNKQLKEILWKTKQTRFIF
jgi:hypothetical protein